MSLMGMDIDAAAGLLGRLDGGAITELGNLRNALTHTVQELQGVWMGEDADRFQASWVEHQANLAILHNALAELGGALGRAISEQRAVSGH